MRVNRTEAEGEMAMRVNRTEAEGEMVMRVNRAEAEAEGSTNISGETASMQFIFCSDEKRSNKIKPNNVAYRNSNTRKYCNIPERFITFVDAWVTFCYRQVVVLQANQHDRYSSSKTCELCLGYNNMQLKWKEPRI